MIYFYIYYISIIYKRHFFSEGLIFDIAIISIFYKIALSARDRHRDETGNPSQFSTPGFESYSFRSQSRSCSRKTGKGQESRLISKILKKEIFGKNNENFLSQNHPVFFLNTGGVRNKNI